MEDKHEQAERMREKVPSTIARSDDKAVRTYKKTLASAEQTYGEGARARRAAMASLKHTHEKVGDHWEPKGRRGPSDSQAKGGIDTNRPTAAGIDAEATRQHLYERAKDVGIRGRSRMSKGQLVDALRKQSLRASARARQSR